MKYDFWLFFGVGILLSCIILLVLDFFDAEYERLMKKILRIFFGSLFFGLLISFFPLFFASKILIIKDNHKYEYEYHFFQYIDGYNQKNKVKPGNTYLDNQSSHDLLIYSVYYKKRNVNYNSYKDIEKMNIDTYEERGFSRFKNYHEPDFVFTDPPKSVKIKKYESGMQYFLIYKEDFNEELLEE